MYKKIKYITLFAVLIGYTAPAESAAGFDSISTVFSDTTSSGAIALAAGFAAGCVVSCIAALYFKPTKAAGGLNNSEQNLLNELLEQPRIPKQIGIPDFIARHCVQPAGLLPAHIQLMAQEARQALDVPPVFFYQTDYLFSHACNKYFNKIGLKNPAIENTDLFTFLHPSHQCPDSAGPESVADYAYLKEMHKYAFFKTLYHELIHIKNRHSDFNEHNVILGQEMEAELGATYYLILLTPERAIMSTGILELNYCHENDDDMHPTAEEHSRYKRELIRHVYINNEPLLKAARQDPNAYFNSVVSPLVRDYMQEKATGIRAIFPLSNGEN